MRITQAMVSRMGTEQLFAQRNRLAQTQEQALTGKRLNRPSDDSLDYQKAANLKNELDHAQSFLRSTDASRVRLQLTENALADSADLLSRAKVIALEARNGANAGQTDEILRDQVESLFDELLSYSNTRSPGGGYIFSGVSSDSAAFTASGPFVSGSPPPSVSFTGAAGAVRIEIDQDVFVEVTRNGEQAFQGAADAFAALTQLWEGIDQQDDALLDAAIGDLDLAFDQLVSERAQLGSEENKLDAFEARLRTREEGLLANISLLEDVDALEVYSDLVAREAALQGTLSVTSRLISTTLLDFI